MTGPAYPAARAVSATVLAHFRHLMETRRHDTVELAPQPSAEEIEAIIDAAFWASLRREEGFSPKISLAFLPPEQAWQPLRFERSLPLSPTALARLAPAVERPHIHLCVARDGGDHLRVWGIARKLPRLCFVLEVIEPGLLVIKYRRGQDPSKFVNVAVLKGDQIKVVDEAGTSLPDCPALITSLLGFGSPATSNDSVNVLVQLAASMRAHGRGGSLLVVPHGTTDWRESIVWPVPYSVLPPLSELAELMRQKEQERDALWQEALLDAVEAIGGLTAVDGATIINDQYEVMAFGAKIGHREGRGQVERVIITEPIVGDAASIVHPVQFGGTRHLSAAQFVQNQQDSIALVASQDGRFTVFAWSPCEGMVHAHRVETLLL
ncbi:MAG TPA: hypothetical protein VF779_08030 [Pyrinomonadaceae bacterium]